MSVIVEFTLSGDDFLLGDALRAVPGMVVEIERVVAHADERVTPYFWVSEDEDGAFEAAAAEDPSVEDVVRVDDFGSAKLYRAEWRDEASGLVDAFRSIDMVLLEATGERGSWQLRLRFDDRSALEEMNDYRREHDIATSVERIYHPDEPNAGGQYGLTPAQREALVTALSAGYYEVPRRVTHEELAEELNISQQAVSTRLHRAHGSLVDGTLTVGEPEPEPGPGTRPTR